VPVGKIALSGADAMFSRSRILLLFFALTLSVCAAETPLQVITWPETGTPLVRFSFSKCKEMGAMGNQHTYVTDTVAENLSSGLIREQRFTLYVFDKKQVRIGEAGISITNVGVGQTVKFQTMMQTSGVPATFSLVHVKVEPRTISLTVNSVPQGALLKVDGEDAGTTPKLIKVGLGKHLLAFSKEGFNTGTFPVEFGPDDVSGGSVSYELGTAQFDTIQMRDGTVLVGDLDSVAGMEVVVRMGGILQHIDRNKIKSILLVQRQPPNPQPSEVPNPQ
jgi:hypothetical protein